MVDEKNLHINRLTEKKHPEPDVPVGDAWEQMKTMLDAVPVSSTPNSPAAGFTKKLFWLGGGGLVIVVAFVYFISRPKTTNPPADIVYASGFFTQKNVLSGGDSMFLDQYSRITLQQTTGKENKAIIKNGGGYFSLQKQTPLSIYSGSLLVTAPGADIYVAYDSAARFSSVQVEAGGAVIKDNDTSFQLQAGESVQFNETTRQFDVKKKGDVNVVSYATLIFEFNNTPLNDAVAYIEKAYGVKISFSNEALKHCRITTRFDNRTLTQVLDIMAYTLGFDYTLDAERKQVLITAEHGCE